MAAVLAFSPVSARFASLYERSEGTDFTITCKGRSWKVHHFVLSSYSDVLACACNGPFKEAQEKTIDLSEDGEDSVDALVRYMYYFDYAIQPAADPYAFHLSIVILADKYNTPQLAELANEKLDTLLKCSPLQCTPDLIAAIELAYKVQGPTTDFLLSVILIAIKRGKEHYQEYSALMRALPCLAQDVAIGMVGFQTQAPPADCTIPEGDKIERACSKCAEQRPAVARVIVHTIDGARDTRVHWHCTVCSELLECESVCIHNLASAE